jgi:hypothetical protein
LEYKDVCLYTYLTYLSSSLSSRPRFSESV